MRRANSTVLVTVLDGHPATHAWLGAVRGQRVAEPASQFRPTPAPFDGGKRAAVAGFRRDPCVDARRLNP